MPPVPPSTLCQGRYHLRDLLGAGGMAVVYRAWDEALRVERAVKLLAPGTAAHKEARARLETEAWAMASLQHPNVVSVYDIREDDGQLFLVMELVTGGTLWDWVVAHGSMPPRLAVELLLPVIDAVVAAHAAGVVHRDLKPSNILLGADGRPRISDFGIARIQEAGGALTSTGSTLGTWAFMAPEQRRDARGVDERSDVYSLAATLYALIRGQLPFDLFAAGEDSSILDGVPTPLAQVIRDGTRFLPADRIATARALKAALEACLPGLDPVPAGTPPLGTRPPGDGDAGAPTADLSDADTTTAGPAIRLLQRRRPALGHHDEAEAEASPRDTRSRWLLTAVGPALVALVVGSAVLAFAGRDQGLWARRTLALTGAASVDLQGDVAAAWLQDAAGQRHAIGTVRPGRYAVKVRFRDGEQEETVAELDLGPGQLADIACAPAERRCEVHGTAD